jgi:hypothetical protein
VPAPSPEGNRLQLSSAKQGPQGKNTIGQQIDFPVSPGDHVVGLGQVAYMRALQLSARAGYVCFAVLISGAVLVESPGDVMSRGVLSGS